MTEKKHTLFVTTRPSRAGELQSPSVESEAKRMLEESWAESLGIDVEKLRAGVEGTESSSSHQTCSASLTGTATTGGKDVTTDSETDCESDQMTDDITNDGGNNTGGVIDIPF